ncbi:hypothetical protein J437_LFUL010571 [Ladona fulva]|uniref:Uncharacterized protein n=1 Tax=Ladona fulva TaxID=123851 RepID=A0A8K0KGV5_LADFU|nr:hypothetical protein J437_LFUL010571 [Ladona fulva]
MLHLQTCSITGLSYTYQELRNRCHRFSRALVTPPEDGGVGLQKGDVIALLMHNCPEYPLVFLGAIEAGVTVTTANPSFTAGEISRQLNMTKTRILVTKAAFLEKAGAAIQDVPSCNRIIVIDDLDSKCTANNCLSFTTLMSTFSNSGSVVHAEPLDLDSTVVLPFSSGTEGLPKGVELTHTNLVSAIQMAEHPEFIDSADSEKQDVCLAVLPFYHIYGMNGLMNLSIRVGREIVAVPKFESTTFIDTIKKFKNDKRKTFKYTFLMDESDHELTLRCWKCSLRKQLGTGTVQRPFAGLWVPSVVYLVPPLLLFLAKHPDVRAEDLASIRQVICGAAPATKTIIDAFLERAERKNVDFREGYGLTETSALGTLIPKWAGTFKTGSCGCLMPFTEARIVDSSGKGVGAFSKGELLIRGPQIMKGYLNNEEATKKTIDEDGWLHTGDIAYFDEDGFFYIVDRLKELIKVKGNQVSPTELEEILHQYPGVADVAVVGIPDLRAGELPAAFVVRTDDKQGSDLKAEDLHSFLSTKVAQFKQLLGGIRFLDSIPKSVSGKVLRRELLQIVEKEKLQK